MGLSIKDTVKKTFTSEVVKQIATHVGEGEGRVERGIATAVPAVLQNMSLAAETDEGLHALQTELDKADVDVLDSFGRRFGETPNIIVERGRSLMKNLFGKEEAKSTATRVASAAGIGNVSAEMVTGAVVPVVTGALAKHRKTAGLSVAGMRSALAAQLKETSVAGASFPPGEAPVREKTSWTALLFPLLALLGLIVLGISLVSDGKSKANGEQLASSNAGDAGAESSEHGKVDEGGGERGDSGKTAKQDGAGDGAGDGEVANNISTENGGAGQAEQHPDGQEGDSSKDAAEHDGDAADHDGELADDQKKDGHESGDRSSDDAADAGSKAAAAAENAGTDYAVELPAAVSKATRILNAVEDVAGARNAIPKLNGVTDRIAKLRGEQKEWPDETQSLVRRRLFALMPALNDAVGKMLEKDEYLTTLEKPLTNFIDEIDLLVPER